MAAADTAAGTDDPIRHVIVLALENRSFDHMLGACQAVKEDLDGIAADQPPRSNSYGGQSYNQKPGAARIVVEDPRHETPHVLVQLGAEPGGTPNGGFVKDYVAAYPMLQPGARGEVMRYHALDALPALHALARSFTVCDKWFASVPGPTWTNRLFLMSGTSLGRVKMPGGLLDLNLHWYDQPSVFDRLNERGLDWAVYHGDTPLSLLLTSQWELQNRARYHPMGQFFADAAAHGRPHPVSKQIPDFPAFAFIEPAYLDPGANDDHPSHDVLAGEALIASVYNAVRGNERLWNESLLVVLFDEHGGFYDHVSPPGATPPDHHQEEYTFDRLGARVPALLVSPYAPNKVIHDQMDHTSLLKYLIDKWGLGPLGERTAQAKTFAGDLLTKPRADTPAAIPAVPQEMTRVTAPPRQPLNDHQTALVALSHALESMADEDPAVVAARSRQVLTSPQSKIDVAVDRVETFLSRGAAEVLKKV